MRYYPRTVRLLTSIIETNFGEQVPKRDRNNMPAHIIWMMQEMQTFSDDRKGSAIAGQWIGWVFREMERSELIPEARCLEELKQDVRKGDI